ncbi:aldose 1-epimerase [Paraburkholderia sp. Ac-20342]|uniref:aldose 1-epimerase n=1 Tax=Paraburkholderia sp. Ac-20342 TaxID=2703889 RepID=UPI00198201D7|nr:aldose 1-epimerase [Paraburkholderia sp. Ac-20342]MBN3849135.1 aldose 1-epimerase [Paraburkholderia sp. Ac-20342]
MLDTWEADLREPVFVKAARLGGPDCGAAERMHRQTMLSNAYLRLGIEAGMHGGITQLDWHDRGIWTPVFRRAERSGHMPIARGLSCQPLIRITKPGKVLGAARKSSGGRLTGVGRPFPLAYVVLADDWNVESADERTARLKTEVAGSCRAIQTYELDGPTLAITVELENCGRAPLQCGIDIRPVLTRDLDTRISAPAGGIWLAGESGHAPRLVPTPVAWQFGVTHHLPATKIDHTFTRWGGRALVEWPARQFSLAIVGNTDCYRLRAHPQEDSFSFQVVNDQSEHNCIQDGDNVCGLTVLGAGKTLTRRVSFTVERLVSLTRTTRPSYASL